APVVYEERRRGVEGGAVASLRLRQAREARAVELHAVDLLGDVAVLRAGEVDPARGLGNAVNAPDLPRAVRDLLDEAGGCRRVIEVRPAGTLAAPDERAVLEPLRVVVERLDPRG